MFDGTTEAQEFHAGYDSDRWTYLSHDPIRLLGGIELFSYTRDPLSYIDPVGLNCRIGNAGEAEAKQFLQENGYTDIVAIQNPSGHGIDLAAKDASGVWTFFEVKASDGSRVPSFSAAQADSAAFIRDRLEKAAAGTDGAWQSVSPAVQSAAQGILNDLGDSTPRAYAIGVSNVSSSPLLRTSSW